MMAGSASAQTEQAAILANACTSCHGVDGHSETAIPSIAGLGAEAFYALMTGFRDGTVTATIMGRIAKGYSDDQLHLLANFYAER